jgi:hypothetical protein
MLLLTLSIPIALSIIIVILEDEEEEQQQAERMGSHHRKNQSTIQMSCILHSVDAYAWDLPLELASPLLLHGRRRVVPPDIEHVPEVMELCPEPYAAIRMKGADLVEVLGEHIS